ncbi:MAG: methyltransferase domain-containing protein [Burkholderiales bacterium]|nr:methyltransferase domain-containing protein [Burkholderiales bacterium]
MTTRRHFLSLVASAAAWRALDAGAQERFSPFVGSNPDNVRRMVEIAALRAGDNVIDLGSGDGRIVFAALQSRPDVRGVGVDINADLVHRANAAAQQRGLADRARFLHQNAFDADLAKVDVIFMWLFPELMRLLRPKILAQARPGTRVVAATWDLGTWPADAVDDPGGGASPIRRWVVPARIEGGWQWDATIGANTYRFSALFEQRMQHAEGVVRVGNRREILQHVVLRGDALQFALRMTLPGAGYIGMSCAGRVRGDSIEGTLVAQVPRPGDDEAMDEVSVPWRARRVANPGYFSPTGTDLG